MERVIRWTVPAVCAGLLFGCNVQSAPSPPPPSRAQQFVPQPAPGIVLAAGGTVGFTIQNEENVPQPRIPLSEEYVLINVIDINLDFDEPEEQILIVKRRDDEADRIRLMVVDFDALRSTHVITWEGETRATNVRTFALYTNDLIGDHVDELVSFGADADGRQTLDVFRRATGGTQLTYASIFSQSSDASIEITELPRSESYRSLQSAGVSFPIAVYQRNSASDQSMDLLKTTYFWRPQDGRYAPSASEVIPARQVEQAQLRELYNGPVEAIEAFVAGPWYRATGDGIGRSLELAHFDRDTRTVVLHRGESQERYSWLTSYKALYESGPGMWMSLQNEILGTVRRQLTIAVLGMDQILISVEGAEYWNGRYERMTTGLQSSVLRQRAVVAPPFELAGVFRNENDQEIVFQTPTFSFRSGPVEWRGGFGVFVLQEPVLELKVTGVSGSDGTPVPFTQRYTVEFSEQTSEDRLVRRLTLTPTMLTVQGPSRVPGDELVLEQVVYLRD